MEPEEFCYKSILMISYMTVIFGKHIEQNLQEKKHMYITMCASFFIRIDLLLFFKRYKTVIKGSWLILSTNYTFSQDQYM